MKHRKSENIKSRMITNHLLFYVENLHIPMLLFYLAMCTALILCNRRIKYKIYIFVFKPFYSQILSISTEEVRKKSF